MIFSSLVTFANLRSGCHVKSQPHIGDAIYIQIKDFDENRILNPDKRPDVKLEPNLNRHLLKKGDILFAAKGTNNFAAIFTGSNYPALASTSFIVIDSFGIDRLFLEWYLNRARSKKFFNNASKGTAIPSIPIGYLQDFQVPNLDGATIDKVIKLAKLSETIFEKQNRLNELNYQNIQNQIATLIDF